MTARYTAEFKNQVVKYVLDNKPTERGKHTAFLEEVGKKFGVYPNTIYGWMPGHKSPKNIKPKLLNGAGNESHNSHIEVTLKAVRKQIKELQEVEAVLVRTFRK
jgi:transposase-like protein